MAWQKKAGWTANRVRSGWARTAQGWPRRAGWAPQGRRRANRPSWSAYQPSRGNTRR